MTIGAKIHPLSKGNGAAGADGRPLCIQERTLTISKGLKMGKKRHQAKSTFTAKLPNYAAVSNIETAAKGQDRSSIPE